MPSSLAATNQILVTRQAETSAATDLLIGGPSNPYRIVAANVFGDGPVRASHLDDPTGGKVFGLTVGDAVDLWWTVQFTDYPDLDNVQADIDVLAAIWQPGADLQTLDYQIDSTTRRRYGVCQETPTTTGALYWTERTVHFLAQPRSYTLTPTTLTAVASGTLANDGHQRTVDWTASVAGPCVDPKFTYEYEPGGAVVTVDFDGLTVASGETLTLHPRRGEAILSGPDPDAGVLGYAVDADGRQARLLTMPPGDVDVTFTATSGTSVASWTVRGAH